MKHYILAAGIAVTTGLLLVAGTLHPNSAAASYAGGSAEGGASTTSSAQAAVEELGAQLKRRAFSAAYSDLANNAEFTEADFERDLLGTGLSLRTYATLDSFEVRPLHQTTNDAQLVMTMRYSSPVGIFNDARNLHAVKRGERWAIQWPIKHEPRVPPQVISVTYLRWDVIYSGAGDEWGTQDVEGPHVRIVDMHPIDRAEGTVVMGELLNEDVVPAYVNVRATLVRKDGVPLDNEEPFDMISHTLLPKQVTPFIIHFPHISLSQVASIRMEPLSALIATSADPIVEIENQGYTAEAGPAATGQLTNQSGQAINVSHVLSTFYDKDGKIIWVGGQYIDRTLQPQTPVGFRVTVPHDLSDRVSNERTIVSTYVQGNAQ